MLQIITDFLITSEELAVTATTASLLIKMKYHWRNTDLNNLQEVFEGVHYVEEWKDVIRYEGLYQVSNFGRVKSFIVSKSGRIRKGVPAMGYPQVQLKGHGDGSFETGKIHRLVAIAFIPNPDCLPEVNHLKGDRGDCRAWRLEWSTASDNMKHAYRELGKKNNLQNQKGEGHYKAKFKKGDILKIREMAENGKSITEIAATYNEKTGPISRIVNKKRWAHI